MVIKNLKITSFRGIKEKEYEFDELLNVFKGKNGIGKTTIIDCIMWLICGETLVYGKQDSDNKNKQDTKEVVQATLEFDNGTILERKYYEAWIENDEGNLEFSRMENQYRINGAKFQQKEYFAKINRLIGLSDGFSVKNVNILRALMDYNYLFSIKYTDTRNFLMKLLNLTSDEELLKDKKYEKIKVDLALLDYDVNKCKNKYANEYDSANKELETINNLIEEKQNSIKDIDMNKYDELLLERTNLFETKFENSDEYKELLAKDHKLDNDIDSVQEEINHEIGKLEKEMKKLIVTGDEKLKEIKKYEAQNNELEVEIKSKEHNIGVIKQQQNRLQNNIDYVKEKVAPNLNLCPNCGFELNKEILEMFNTNKEQEVAYYKEQIDDCESEIEVLIEQIKICEQDRKEIETKINPIIEEYNKDKDKYFELEDKWKELKAKKDENPQVQKLIAQKVELKGEIEGCNQHFNETKNERINELQREIDFYYRAKVSQREIENLKDKVQLLKVTKAIAENKKMRVLEFKEQKLKMIRDNISSVFNDVEIELIEESPTTGVVSEVCYAKLKDVEFNGINNGHRYLVGIKVIESIKKHLGLEDLPIIFDRLADIDKNNLKEILKNTKSQIFATKVSNDEEITLTKGLN